MSIPNVPGTTVQSVSCQAVDMIVYTSLEVMINKQTKQTNKKKIKKNEM